MKKVRICEKQNKILSYLFIVCSFLVYTGAYAVREILGTVSPQLLEHDVLNEAALGVFSSIMFASYGIGQFINGFLGEKVPAKGMISVGMISAAVCTFGFAMTDRLIVRYLLWAICGYALSMLYAPLTKTITSYLAEDLARIAYVFLSVGAILGSTVAGVLAGISGTWKATFFATAAVLTVPLLLFLLVNAKLEKKNDRSVVPADGTESEASTVPKFSLRTFVSCFGVTTVCFLIVNMLIKASRHAVSFWAPTYISAVLGYDARVSAVLFGMTSVMKVVAPFFSIWLYQRMKRNERAVILASLLISAACFLLMRMVTPSWLRLAFLTVALFFVECGGSIIGSVFLLSFKQFGCVSAICGFFDSTAYLTAALCSVLFSKLLTNQGWGVVVGIWTVLPILGAMVIAVVVNQKKFTVLSSQRRKQQKDRR